MLISEQYLEQQRILHGTNASYGTTGRSHADAVLKVAKKIGAKSILDYGAGKRLIEKLLRDKIKVVSYDPAIEAISKKPEPADLVVCTDVLEHIEPECLDEVLDDMKRVTRKMLFATVATGPADKLLPDGRNAHLIQEPMSWWLPRLKQRFNIVFTDETESGFLILGNR
jgi:2-polyprenyl-3-methyl-5-hydroxy-6-metoxy-1,4-benzoquinol methylase